MPRIIAAALVVCALAGCSSNSGSSSSGGSSSASSATTSTLDPVASSSLDMNGATAFLTLLAAQLKVNDPTITSAEADCIPSAVLALMTPQELFAIIDAGQATLTPDQATRVHDALRSCGLTDEQIAKVRL